MEEPLIAWDQLFAAAAAAADAAVVVAAVVVVVVVVAAAAAAVVVVVVVAAAAAAVVVAAAVEVVSVRFYHEHSLSCVVGHASFPTSCEWWDSGVEQKYLLTFLVQLRVIFQ